MKKQYNSFVIFFTFRGQLILLVAFVIIKLLSIGNFAHCEGASNHLAQALGEMVKAMEIDSRPKDLYQFPLISSEPHSIEEGYGYGYGSTPTGWMSLDLFYTNMQASGEIFDPFLGQLLLYLLSIENDYSDRQILQMVSLDHEIAQKIYRFFPEPYPGIDFYSDSDHFEAQFRFMLHATQNNPLILFAYATYLHYFLVKDTVENDGIYPSLRELADNFQVALDTLNATL